MLPGLFSCKDLSFYSPEIVFYSIEQVDVFSMYV